MEILEEKLFIMMFLFIVSIILFILHRCFEKSITDYNKIWKNNWKINIFVLSMHIICVCFYFKGCILAMNEIAFKRYTYTALSEVY